MSAQLTLDDIPTRTDPVLGWRKFVADNPRCYAAMVGRMHDLIANRMHASIYALFEFARNLGPHFGEGPYLIDNRWSRPAREMLTRDYPEFSAHLRTRGSGA